VVQALPALAGGAQEDPQVVDDLLLADVLVEPLRPQGGLDPEVLRIGDPGEDAVIGDGHGGILAACAAYMPRRCPYAAL
jgi:hypothetical protein